MYVFPNAREPPAMKTVLICHEGDELNRQGLARWLASFTTVAGVVVIREHPSRMRRRLRRELLRVGVLRFVDVLAFRLYYRLAWASNDARWVARRLAEICDRYPASNAPELITASPNSAEAERFIKECAPDLVIARCKTLLQERVFSIPAVAVVMPRS